MSKLVDTFGGVKGEEQNALMTALFNSAGGEEKVYKYLDEIPKTSFVVKLIDSLHELGYEIKKYKIDT